MLMNSDIGSQPDAKKAQGQLQAVVVVIRQCGDSQAVETLLMSLFHSQEQAERLGVRTTGPIGDGLQQDEMLVSAASQHEKRPAI